MSGPVSIIIPTYNRRDLLEKAAVSVFAQTRRDFELIIVDDASTDGTAELIMEFPGIVYIRNPENLGPAAARNRGIRAARHEFIAFLDSDDWFDENKLAVQAGAMARKPEFLVSHTEEIWYRGGVLLNQKKKHKKAGGDIFAQCLDLCAVSMSTVMVRKRLFELAGLFDEDLPCCEDYDFWLRVSARYPFLLIDEPLTMKDGGRSDQVSFRFRTGMDRFRIRAIQKILDNGQLTPGQREMAVRELARKCRIYGNGCIKHGRPQEGRRYLGLADDYS